jgi:dTDP-3-amino-3,4,6-trideoxy-alpha-D-glucose transaminase
VIPFNDLKPLRRALAEPMDAAVRRALESGWYILGPEVEAFEFAFATYHGVGSAVGVANGTDAIELALRAAGVGPGDEVITVAHTAVATVCAVERAGARPVLVDVDPATLTMDPAAACAAITTRTRALLPVHLYGHPAEMDTLTALAARHGLLLVEDCAQAHGARYKGRPVGTFGQLAAFSFYPTKILGAYGDGGAVLTSDPGLAARLRRLRTYGQAERYHHLERGINSRLDEIQAAILGVKLAHLDAQIAERRRLADCYRDHLGGVEHPVEADGVEHAYHLYVVRSPRRDDLRARLRELGMETQIHYPLPVHLQPAYADLGYAPGSLPATEAACATIASLPMYSGLDANEIVRVGRAMVPFLGKVA